MAQSRSVSSVHAAIPRLKSEDYRSGNPQFHGANSISSNKSSVAGPKWIEFDLDLRGFKVFDSVVWILLVSEALAVVSAGRGREVCWAWVLSLV